MEGFTDTILIDCNRANSEEGKADNKEQYSQFTCKTGVGVKVNPGDKVSVHSAFVSQVGCGAGVIEFTGKNLETEYEVESTDQVLFQKYWNHSQDGTEIPYQPYRDLHPWGAGYVGYSNTKKTHQLRDNELHLSISYYKNSNGNGYVHLPRRFDCNVLTAPTKGTSQKVTFDPNDSNYNHPDWMAKIIPATTQGPVDNYWNGRSMMIGRYPIQRCLSDIQYFKHGKTPVPAGPHYASNSEATPGKTDDRIWKQKNDNSRYTIYVMADQYFAQKTREGYFIPQNFYTEAIIHGDSENKINTGPNRDTFQLNVDADHDRDPCLCEFVRYKEDKLLSLEKGFQAPQSIADSLTTQLNERTTTKLILGRAGGSVPTRATPTTHTSVGSEQVQVSIESDSSTYKGFGCATAWTFEQANYEAYWGNKPVVYVSPFTAATDDGLRAMDYMSNYQTIGVKRPDVWDTGHEVLKNCEQISDNAGGNWQGVGVKPLRSWRNVLYPRMMNSLDFGNNQDGEIITNWKWTTANLDLLKAWFDAQSEDPSLYNTYYASQINKGNSLFKLTGLSTTNSRFIHMNIQDNPPFDQLGDDQYEAEAGTTPTDGTLRGDGQSAPLFIYHDEVAKNNQWGGDEVSSMYYGFALKRRVQKTEPIGGGGAVIYDEDCIAFNTSRVGGIPRAFWSEGTDADPGVGTDDYYINADADGVPTYKRYLGFDPHFNAYGNDSIMLYAGYLNGNVNERTFFTGTSTQKISSSTQWQQAQNIQKRLIGASNPGVIFDPENSKFQFSSLHTPEYTGNTPDAGGPGDPGEPVNADAGTPVWYLNKRVNRTDFCPEMMPYQLKLTAKDGDNNKITFIPHNFNLQPWNIFDADSGIFIDSFNINEKDWDNSFMGILGFSYEQFNATNSADTRQTRINDNIVFDPSGALTTNAIVNGSDIIQWRSNQFGANFYNNQLPIGMVDNSVVSQISAGEFCPVVTENQTSASIQAEHLARKMLTPYYLIRSDIISDHKYTGGRDGGEALPIVHVVNKENGFGDFFFQGESENTFTITKSRVISQVTSSIHNPDMSLANTTDGSGIIYKIQKMNNADLNIASEVLNKNKSKSK